VRTAARRDHGQRPGHQILCDYNDLASLEAAVAQAGDDLAAIFAAPFKHDAFIDQADPDPAYARRARELADATGALLVVDDVRAGFRLARDCSWSRIGVQPDLSTWGKCVANGHPISVMLGNDKARKAAATIYVTGSFWYQAAPMAAALQTLKLIRESDYLERITALGERLRAGLSERATAAGFGLRQTGPGRHAAVPVRGRSGPAQGLLLRLRDAGPRGLCAPLAQHVSVRGDDRGRHRRRPGRRRGRFGR
jgi:glutamate-1-semialdehyde 2,1-aminomutase